MASQPDVSFGELLQRYRGAAGLTQEALAERAGLSARGISDLERGLRQAPYWTTTQRLAEALGLTEQQRNDLLRAGARRRPAAQFARPAEEPASALEAAPRPPLPSGTVTFLFTDVEGSTRLLEQYPQAYPAALARHHALLCEAVTAHGGAVFETLGDGVYAAFARATDAVAAALAAQRGFWAETWGDLPVLRVRMAVHTGDVEWQGEHYSGPALYRCARLIATGHGGQVLLSGATADLVRDGLPAEARLDDLGTHRLRDLAEPERVFQLSHPELPGTFPPLQSLDPVRHNLPGQLTSFIGREQEVAEVRRLLGSARLVNLIGPGGVGKTRLALQVAAEVMETYPDGVWLVDLAPLADPSLVPQAVASALHVREAPGRPLAELLAELLQPKHSLLVLDNCEHLVDACARLADGLLRACPHLRILATSREVLGVGGETVWSVPSLSVPADGPVHPQDLLRAEAARLFVERATAAAPSFTATEANALAVAQVCRRLDGLPLAIELAAARVRTLSVEHISARLNDRFRLLTGGSRAAPSRQQTLRAAVEWSYGLLSEAEQMVFNRLSVFAGDWTLGAAEAVCARQGIEEHEVLDVLSRLVDKSLVLADAGAQSEVRYRLLETLRAYGLERLATSNELETVQGKHAAYFLALAEQAEPELKGAEQGVWLALLEQEHDNLRAALQWTIARAETELGLRLAGALWRFWWVHGHLSDGRRWMEGLLAVAGNGGAAPAATRAKALSGAGVLAIDQGDYGRAAMLLEESLTLFRDLGDKGGSAWALGNRGLIATYQGDYLWGAALLEQSLTLSRELGDQRGIAWALGNLGGVARDQGDNGRAATLLEESLRLSRELGDKGRSAWALGSLGLIARDQGDYPRATALLEESLGLSRELGDKGGIAWTLGSLGVMAMYQGSYSQATASLEESLRLSRELGDRGRSAQALGNLGLIARDQGDNGRAAALQEESLALLQEVGDKLAIAWALGSLGVTAIYQGNYGRAGALLKESLALFREVGDRHGMTRGIEQLAIVACAQEELERAARLFGAADALREAIGVPLPPPEQAVYERNVAAVRAGLGEQAFAAAWAQGRGMAPEQAIAEPGR